MATEAASGIVPSCAAARDAHDEGERRAVLERAWAGDDPRGTAALDGMDFGELGDDRRMARIVGFLGPFPPA